MFYVCMYLKTKTACVNKNSIAGFVDAEYRARPPLLLSISQSSSLALSAIDRNSRKLRSEIGTTAKCYKT